MNLIRACRDRRDWMHPERSITYIMVRGIDKTVIFREDRDKLKFLEKMGAAVTGGNRI